MSKLYDQVTGVSDAETFAAFVRELRAEVLHNAQHSGPFLSENYDIDDYLEAMQAWSSTDIARTEIARLNPWASAARLLLVGHYYE